MYHSNSYSKCILSHYSILHWITVHKCLCVCFLLGIEICIAAQIGLKHAKSTNWVPWDVKVGWHLTNCPATEDGRHNKRFAACRLDAISSWGYSRDITLHPPSTLHKNALSHS